MEAADKKRAFVLGSAIATLALWATVEAASASSVVSIQQQRVLSTFALVDLAEGENLFEVDEVRSNDPGPFDDDAISLVIEGDSHARGEAFQASDIRPDQVWANGNFVAISRVVNDDPFAQALGLSKLVYAFEVVAPTAFDFDADLSAGGAGSANIVWRDQNNEFLILDSFRNDARGYDLSGVLEPGSYQLTIQVSGYSTALPDENEAATGQFSLTLDFQDVASTPELASQLAPTVRVSPNPVFDRATLFFVGDVPFGAAIEVFDVHGRVVRDLGVVQGDTAIWNRRDDLGEWVPSGVYYIRAGSSPATKILAVTR